MRRTNIRFGILLTLLVVGVNACGISIHDDADHEFENDLLNYEITHTGGLTQDYSIRKSGCIDLGKDYARVVYSNSQHSSAENPFVLIWTLNEDSLSLETYLDGELNSKSSFRDHHDLPFEYNREYEIGNGHEYNLNTKRTRHCGWGYSES